MERFSSDAFAAKSDRRVFGKSFLLSSLLLPGCLSESGLGRDVLEVGLYYPELSDYQLKAAGLLHVGDVNVRWFNFSEHSLDTARTSMLYQVFVNLSQSGTGVNFLSEKGKAALSLKARFLKDRVLFIVPENAPSPAWSNIGGASYLGATTRLLEREGPYVSFVKVAMPPEELQKSSVLNTLERQANAALFTEVCQSLVEVVGKEGAAREVIALTQEYICNSLGAAVVGKQIGLTYRQYVEWSNRITSFNVVVLPEREYNKIPVFGLPINVASREGKAGSPPPRRLPSASS